MTSGDVINLLDKKLEARGILEAARDHGWTISGSGWRYPVYSLTGKPFETMSGQAVKRWKNADSNGSPKYCWEPKEAPRPTYYTIPGVQACIERAGGVVYLASGEPDVLAFYAAALGNVLCWFGEGNVPESLAEDLREDFGVTAVICYPDLDKPGRTWAATIATRLQGSGITLDVRQLPADLGDKGDINKLWIACKFNRDDFLARLQGSPRLEVKPEPPKAHSAPLPEHSEPPPGLWQAIESRLGVTTYKDNGWSKNVVCPFNHHEHDDKQPGFALNKQTYSGKCQKDKLSRGWLAMAEALNIRVADYKPFDVRQAAPEPPAGTTPATATRFLPKRLSDLRNAPVLPNLSAEIPAHSLGAIFGPSGGYKTFYALNYQLLPMVRDGKRAVFMSGEGDDHGTYNRIAAWCQHNKVDQATIEAGLFIFTEPVYLMQAADVAALIAAIAAFEPAIIVIDTLAVSALGADENSSRDMGMMIDACRRIIRETGATVALVHHTGKNGASERGSSALRAQCDWMIELASDDSLVTVSSSKSRNAKPFDTYYLKPIDIGDSKVLIPADKVVQTDDDKLTPRQAQILEAVNLEVFIEAGARASQIIKAANVPEQTVYKTLSSLKRLAYIRQAQSGDPYYITDKGKQKLSRLSRDYQDSSYSTGTTLQKELSTLSHPFRGDSRDSSLEGASEKKIEKVKA